MLELRDAKREIVDLLAAREPCLREPSLDASSRRIAEALELVSARTSPCPARRRASRRGRRRRGAQDRRRRRRPPRARDSPSRCRRAGARRRAGRWSPSSSRAQSRRRLPSAARGSGRFGVCRRRCALAPPIRRRSTRRVGATTEGAGVGASAPAGRPVGSLRRIEQRRRRPTRRRQLLVPAPRVLGLALLEHREQRRADEDRRVRAGADPDEQREGEVLQRVAAEEPAARRSARA